MHTEKDLHEAIALLKAVAGGEIETCSRKPMIALAAKFRHARLLQPVATYMTNFAHGETQDTACAVAHIETLQSFL